MTKEQLTIQLQNEGYSHIFVWEDAPHAHHPEHVHRKDTAHIVLSGSIEIETDGTVTHYAAGDRFDVSAGIAHTATAGDNGCIYLIAEK